MESPDSPRRVATEQRRRRILAAGVSLFGEQGFLAATSDDIAAAAGVTKRTLYRYVGSKHRLLAEIHQDFINEGLARWQAVYERGGEPPEVLRNLVHEHLAVLTEHRDAIRVFFEEMKHLPPDARASIVEQREAYQGVLAQTLRDGVASGHFREMDVPIVTLTIVGALNELYRWLDPAGPMPLDALGELLAEQIMAGIVPVRV